MGAGPAPAAPECPARRAGGRRADQLDACPSRRRAPSSPAVAVSMPPWNENAADQAELHAGVRRPGRERRAAARAPPGETARRGPTRSCSAPPRGGGRLPERARPLLADRAAGDRRGDPATSPGSDEDPQPSRILRIWTPASRRLAGRGHSRFEQLAGTCRGCRCCRAAEPPPRARGEIGREPARWGRGRLRRAPGFCRHHRPPGLRVGWSVPTRARDHAESAESGPRGRPASRTPL